MELPSPARPSAALALRAFRPLPWRERWFVSARLLTAPLVEVARRAPLGRVADIGCGHGVLTALLAESPERTVVGVDPDARKIAWAREALGTFPNVELLSGTLQSVVQAHRGGFDGVVVCDVLYLLPHRAWAGFLADCAALLAPGGTLLLKEAENDGGWKARKALLQEEMMVRVFRRTQSSGGLEFRPREALVASCAEAGLLPTRVESLGSGYTTPHVLVTALRPCG